MRLTTLGRHPPIRGLVCALGIGAIGLSMIHVGLRDDGLSLRMAFAEATTGLAARLQRDATGIDPEEAEARVALGPGGRDLRLAGDFTPGVAARVSAVLAAHPEVARIHLTSDGGLVEEAVALGALVADWGLDTYVPDTCASACTLAFVRGRNRYLAAGGTLGFHAPYESGFLGRTVPVDAAPERAAYLAAGIAPDFAAQALAVSSDDIWIPDAARLRQAGVVTDIVDTDRFPDSTLDADPSLAGARAQILRNLPVLVAAEAAAIDGLAAWYRDGYADGRSEADALGGLRQRTAAYLRRRFGEADDATVRALGDAVLAALRNTRTADGACAAVARGDLLAVDEGLRAGRRPAPGLGPLLAQGRRGGIGTGPEVGGRRAERGPVSGLIPADRCGALVEAIRQSLTRPAQAGAAALRALLLPEAPPEIASAGPR